MKEHLFSEKDIEKIIKEATTHEERYLDIMVVDGNATEKSIHTISPVKGIIFTIGNEYTGYKHLRERHSQFVYKSYWRTAENGIKVLDRPSKFHPDIAPIHYTKIADAIFSLENKNITNNNRPELFDKYTGHYVHKGNLPEKFHLLTYKDTRIVHTMYPHKRKHNLKSVAKFGKGNVTSTRELSGNYADLIVPYEDDMGVVRYSILIRKFYQEEVERVFIQEHNEKGEPEYLILLVEGKIINFDPFDFSIMSIFQHRDLVDYEHVINQLAEGVEDVQIDLSTFNW